MELVTSFSPLSSSMCCDHKPMIVEETVRKANMAWVLPRWAEAYELYKSVETLMTGHLIGHVAYRLGLLYKKGFPTSSPDVTLGDKYIKLALEHIPKSAEQGDCEALCDFGHMYENGNGVEVDRNLAIHYYQLAADKHHPRGQYNLAVMLQSSQSTKSRAIDYYKLAAKADYPCAQYNLACCLYRMSEWKNAVQYFAKAADWGDEDAQKQIGKMFSNQNTDIKIESNSFLSEKWPQYHNKLHENCQKSIREFVWVMLDQEYSIVPELILIICKLVIVLSPDDHYQNKFPEDGLKPSFNKI